MVCRWYRGKYILIHVYVDYQHEYERVGSNFACSCLCRLLAFVGFQIGVLARVAGGTARSLARNTY